MKVFRLHRSWALLPAALWLAMQLVMAMGFTIAAPAAAKPPAGLAPLVAGLDAVHWLCGPASEAPPTPDTPTSATAGHCYWCQAFGAMPEPPAPPDAVPAFTTCVLPNQPFAEPGHAVLSLRTAGFRSRAPPL